MNYGYARCSTNETKQAINRQVRELKAAGAEEILIITGSGQEAIENYFDVNVESEKKFGAKVK